MANIVASFAGEDLSPINTTIYPASTQKFTPIDGTTFISENIFEYGTNLVNYFVNNFYGIQLSDTTFISDDLYSFGVTNVTLNPQPIPNPNISGIFISDDLYNFDIIYPYTVSPYILTSGGGTQTPKYYIG